MMKYIEDRKKRSNVKNTRLRGIAKKAWELETLCGGHVILHYIDDNGNTYMFADDNTYDAYEKDMLKQKSPTLTFPSVNSLSKLDSKGYVSKTCHKQGKHWKVTVMQSKEEAAPHTSETQVEPDVLVVETQPVRPTPTKRSPGDLNYLPLPRTPTATVSRPPSSSSTTTKTPTATTSHAPSPSITRSPTATSSHPPPPAPAPGGIPDVASLSPSTSHIIEMPVHVEGQTVVSDILLHHPPPSTPSMPTIAPVAKARRKIVMKGKRRGGNTTLCAVCDIIYQEEHDNERHPLGPWLGCETCETWVHRKCINFSSIDIKTKKWYCNICTSKKPHI